MLGLQVFDSRVIQKTGESSNLYQSLEKILESLERILGENFA